MYVKHRLVVLLVSISLLTGCGESGNWGWYVVDPTNPTGWVNIKFLLSGFWGTILVSLVAAILSISISLLVVLPAFSRHSWIRMINRVYVEFIRAIPLLPMLFWIYFGLPQIFMANEIDVSVSPFWGAIIALALSDSAFTAEIFRAGIQSIERGQREGAQTIGLTRFQAMRYIILPQAIRRILPPLANQFIYIVKMSAFASVIGVQELMRKSNELVTQEYRPLEIYTVLVLEYLVLVLIISQGVRWLERKMNADQQR